MKVCVPLSLVHWVEKQGRLMAPTCVWRVEVVARVSSGWQQDSCNIVPISSCDFPVHMCHVTEMKGAVSISNLFTFPFQFSSVLKDHNVQIEISLGITK